MRLVLDTWYDIEIGKINLTTGTVLACDPFLCAVAVPFIHYVDAGHYPVFLDVLNLETLGKRVSSAKIVFDDAVQPDFFVEAVMQDGRNRYPVDAGFACFMDEKARQLLVRVMRDFYASNPNGNYYSDIIEKELRADLPGQSVQGVQGLWAMQQLPDSDLNVALFRSGLGDGWYHSYWGIYDGNRIVSLITDFSFGQFYAEESENS